MVRQALSPRLRTLAPALLLAVPASLAIVLAGSARLEPADMSFNNGTEVASLDPATVTGVPEGKVVRALFEGLCVKDPLTLEALPGMAESWVISEDRRVYTFKIREQAFWSNGDGVTAHDFVYSWQRFLDPGTASEYAYQLYPVVGAREFNTTVDEDGHPTISFDTVGIKASDDRTLVVTLSAPTHYFLDIVAFYPLFPVNRRNLEEARENWPDSWRIMWLRSENIVTNGPFRVAERRVNDRIRLVKSESYWDAEHVAMGSIDVLAVEHYGTGLNLYLTGEVDWIDRVPTAVVPRLMGREDYVPTPYLGTYFFRVNTTKAPFDDARVRRALALAIDRFAICEKIMKAGQRPAWSYAPDVLSDYEAAEMEHTASDGSENSREAAFLADCAEALRLLADAGYGEGGKVFPPFEIHYNTSEAHRDIAEVMSADWKKFLGIDAKLLNQEWKVYLDTQATLGFDVSRSAWIADYNDPNTFLDLFVTGGENNRTGWGDPRYDQLIRDAANEPDPERRMDMLHAAEAILMEAVPILPLYFYTTQSMVNPRLGGWHQNVQDEHFPKYYYWMDDEELAAKRAAQDPALVIVPAPGPSAGLYAPAHGQKDTR